MVDLSLLTLSSANSSEAFIGSTITRWDIFFANPVTIVPKLSLYHYGDEFILRLHAPGMRDNSLAVRFSGRMVHVGGILESPAQNDKGTGRYSERVIGPFSRSTELPEAVVETPTEQRYEDGVLTLRFRIRESGSQAA